MVKYIALFISVCSISLSMDAYEKDKMVLNQIEMEMEPNADNWIKGREKFQIPSLNAKWRDGRVIEIFGPNHVGIKGGSDLIGELDALEEFFVIGTQFDNLKGFKNLQNFKHLSVIGGKIENLQDLSNLPRLRKLSLTSNKIRDINSLSQFTTLESVNLEKNCIKSIAPIAFLHNLTSLNLSKNILENITPISSLFSLEALNLSYTGISHLESLSELTNLRYLNLRGNNIENIHALQFLPHLKELDLGCNEIKRVESLNGLADVVYLYMDNNRIDDLSDLKSLEKLEYLWLNNNLIADLSNLNKFSRLKLVSVDANSVPLSKLSEISSLQNVYFGTQYNVPLLPNQIEIAVGYNISTELTIDGTKSEITIKSTDGRIANDGDEYSLRSDGTLTFNKIGKYIISMCNNNVYSKGSVLTKPWIPMTPPLQHPFSINFDLLDLSDKLAYIHSKIITVEKTAPILRLGLCQTNTVNLGLVEQPAVFQFQ